MKTKYEALKKKHHGLPEFDKLDHYFEISDVEDNDFFLRNIKKKMVEKINHYIELLEGIMQGDTSLAAMHEAKCINERERNIAIKVYREFMRLNRRAWETSVEEVENENIEYIKDAYKVYNENKDSLKKLITLLKESWTKIETKSEEIEYLR